MTLSDLECSKSTSSASRAVSAVAELLVMNGKDNHLLQLLLAIVDNERHLENLESDLESNSASPSSRKYCPLTAACILSFHLNATMKSSANYVNL